VMGNPVVQSLWNSATGLSAWRGWPSRRSSPTAMSITLYCYGVVDGVPNGATLKNATTSCPRAASSRTPTGSPRAASGGVKLLQIQTAAQKEAAGGSTRMCVCLAPRFDLKDERLWASETCRTRRGTSSVSPARCQSRGRATH